MFVFPGFLVLHAIGMGLAAGLSAALDLRVLGVAASMPLVEFRRFRPVLWLGFWVNAVSGVLLLIGYPTKALTNPYCCLRRPLIRSRNAIALALPSHYSIACRLTAVANAQRCSGNLAHPEELFVEFVFGNFVVDLFLDRVNFEDAFVSLRFFCDHTVRKVWVRRLIPTKRSFLWTTASSGRRWRILRRIDRLRSRRQKKNRDD